MIHLDRPRFPPRSVQAYLVAAALAGAALALRLALDPLLAALPQTAHVPFLFSFAAVIAAAILCGSVASLVVAALSIPAAWLLLFPWTLAFLPIVQTIYFAVGTMVVAAVIGTMRRASADVRRANEVLRASEERFRALLESAPDAMVIVDGRQRIALVNARTEALFGYSRRELLGRPAAMLMLEESREGYEAHLAALTAGAPASAALELHGERRDGTAFPVEISLGPLATEAGILVSCVVRDATQRQRIEAELVEASRAKSAFLAGMSHELRTPLNAIIGFSEMIRDAVMGPLDARYRGYGGDIHESGRHLLNIINDILDISKIEGGRLELREETVSIGAAAEACRRIVATMADAAGVSLAIEIPASLPLIRADRLRFQQILLNLMSNAVKFTPSGGRVSVSAAVGTEGAVIAVADTGIGMKAEEIPIALEPFRQIDGALSRRFDGTGLGLPLAKALVELHGGRLDIESAPGAGTVARIRLPQERMTDAA